MTRVEKNAEVLRRKDVTMIPEIRAWDKEKKTMYNVRQIDFRGGDFRSSENEWIKFDNVIFMQSTGVKDKDGMEIYEGDIVSTIHGLCEVKHTKDGYHIVKDNKSSLLSQQDVRVAGNIYENPELMEV